MSSNAPELHSNSGSTDLTLAIDGHVFAAFAVDGGQAGRNRQRVEGYVAATLTQDGHDVSPNDVGDRVDVLVDRGEFRDSGGILHDAQ